MSTQIAGFTTANIAEVETNTKALRMTLRPIDVGALGSYAMGGISGTINAGAQTNAPYYAFRNSGSNVVLVRKIMVTGGNTATAFTAGLFNARLMVARSFSANDTAGTDITPAANSQKLRTSFASSSISAAGSIRIGNTGPNVAGTRTLDNFPLMNYASSIPATAGTPVFPVSGYPLWWAQPGDYPLVLANNEGFIIDITNPATGTWQLGVNVVWDEVASY